ncbi:pilus assembly protein [Pedomonas mirosovicensis]|uniref:pilus assembly protein n=1 Tax=Pedomonas mirosovicensis TaxID=2908641 RepID=UPI00216771D3|nr:pilus assembly protein [Pedomonas mirosovicensis]MCH8685523.1 pilus assembly protein [Pedomonas mirosovicensis]
MSLRRAALPSRFFRASTKCRGLRRLLADRGGNTLPMVAAGLVPLLGVIGASVDVGAAYMVKSQLRAAVDAAVLAGGTVTGDTAKRDAEIERYFKANFPDGYMRTTRTRFVITPEQAPDPAFADEVNLHLEAQVQMPTFFLHILGDRFDHFTLNAEAEVATGKKFNALEAILVLDNTGSMRYDGGGGMTRIQALRQAAKSFIDTVYAGDPEAQDSIAIGMVPYTTTVNVGWLLKSQYIHEMPPFTDSRPSYSNPLRWAGCIESAYTVQDLNTPTTVMEAEAYDTNAATPGEAGAPLYMPQLSPPLLPSNLYLLGDDLNNGIWKRTMETWYNGYYKLARQDILKSDGTINPELLRARDDSDDNWQRYQYYQNGYWRTNWDNPVVWNPANKTSPSPNADCPAESLPPSWGANPDTLKTWIDNNNHAVLPGWGTHSNLGMAWAYRMLRAPHLFKNIVPDNPQGKPEVEAIILMTDGNVNYLNVDDYLKDSGSYREIVREATDDQGLPLKIGHGYYTAYRLPQEKALTSELPWNSGEARDQMELRLLKVCEAARQDGIRVYTIAFKIDGNDQQTREIYRTCATSPRYFFDTADPTALENAFHSIAVDLVQLHLVK